MLLVNVLILSKAQNRCDFTYKIVDGRLRLILAESCVHLDIILSLSLKCGWVGRRCWPISFIINRFE